MQICLDFADPSRATHVPEHGWAKNSQGTKLLWIPVLRLVHQAPNIRKANGLHEELSWGQWSEIRAFEQMVRHFTLTLRELAKRVRLGSDPCFDKGDTEEWNTSHEAASLIPLFVDLAFIYVRRLADHFARASRHVLFTHSRSAPTQYKKLRVIIANKRNLQRLDPICDCALLQMAFERHSGWLDKLRDSTKEDGELQKGIRDIMEHHAVAVKVQHSRVEGEPWQVIARLGEPGINPSFRPDLIPLLKVIVADMASLWTLVCSAASLPSAERLWVAPYGDAVILPGNDDDTTAFWPESQA